MDEEDANILLEKGFEQIKKKILDRKGILEKFESSLYIYTYKSKIIATNKW